MILIIMGILSVGCESVVEIKERVIYPDGTPVKGAKVRQWTDEGYNGSTITNDRGEWALIVPSDTVIYLCIDDGNFLACYECGILITPALDSNSTSMITDGCSDLQKTDY